MWLLVVVLVLAVLGVSPAPAVAKVKKPKSPNCAHFSARKVSDVLDVGKRMYLAQTLILVGGSDCTYQGFTKTKANQLASTQVPFNQITYYPTAMIDILKTTKHYFDFEKAFLHKQQWTDKGALGRRDHDRIGSEDYWYTGMSTGAGLPECDPMLLYSNWTGPPACAGQPTLLSFAELAWIPLGHDGSGRMIYLTAGDQEGQPMYLSRVLRLGKDVVSGALY